MNLFSFQGAILPVPYALWSGAAFFSQHLLAAAALTATGYALALDWLFLFVPLRAVAMPNMMAGLMVVLAMACLLVSSWVLAALAFRRARDAGISEWAALYAIAPLVQLPAIMFLSVLPSRAAAAAPETAVVPSSRPGRAAAVQGMLAGLGLTLVAVATGALVFGAYGFGMFLVAPFVIGVTTGYLANRHTDLGGDRTVQFVSIATVLGSVSLVLSALEGVVCILLVAPLAIGLALIGGLLGRAIALVSNGSPMQTVSGLALLPLVFALEAALPPVTHFDTIESIDVAAPPQAVWQAIVRMDPIEEPPALPFRLGIAYPLGGEIDGEGVGALRRGLFSTGTATERVTEWLPNRKLAFAVLKDVPAMRELSPYEHVHAPHVEGYFSTTSTSFELLPRADGGTRIVERTSHILRLDPAFYWLPMARSVVHWNNVRVLEHIRRQAEEASAPADEP